VQASLKLMGAVNGPLTGMFLIGVLFPWANKKVLLYVCAQTQMCAQGVLIGALLASIISVCVCAGSVLMAPADRQLLVSTNNCSALHIATTRVFANVSSIRYRDDL
jgi:hypothetical protein